MGGGRSEESEYSLTRGRELEPAAGGVLPMMMGRSVRGTIKKSNARKPHVLIDYLPIH